MKRSYFLFLLFIIHIILSGCITPEPNQSIIYMYPSSEVGRVGESHTFYVMCEPLESLKGWEIKLKIDSNLIWTDYGWGTIWENYTNVYYSPSPHFSNGIIDRCYGVSLGNVTYPDSGSLMWFTFIASKSGIYQIELSYVALYNSTSQIENVKITSNSTYYVLDSVGNPFGGREI